MKKERQNKSWKYFCNCPICDAMKKAEEAGRSLSLQELQKAFKTADKKQTKK